MRRIILMLAVTGFIGGCSDTLYYYQKTTAGFDASASTPERSGHVVLGYKRRFATIVPEVAKDGEAVSVISCTQLHKEGMFDLEVSEDLATGTAAVNFATALSGNSSGDGLFARCFTEAQ